MEREIKENDNYNIRSPNHEMYLQLVQKSTIILFDDRRCFVNIIESKPWR